jgi:SAM-dependent methyltransferase
MHPDEVWLAASRPLIRPWLPPPPARVLELGCGEFGGHVPALLEAGYDAVGIDPEAPEGLAYQQIPFEEYDGARTDALIASLSLHHVADLDAALDQVSGLLNPGGTLIVVEWASENFDLATAQWAFARLPEEVPADNGWLHRKKAEWEQSGLPWEDYLHGYLRDHGLHPAKAILSALESRFTTTHTSTGPYYFPELEQTEEAEEQAAINAGEIQATRLLYVGRKPYSA